MPIIKVDEGYRGTKLPRLDGENTDVFPGSSMSVLGLWVFMLRNRFHATAAVPMPWIWEEELRPADDENGGPLPEDSPRKVLIDSAYNVEKSIRDYYPGIYVGRGGKAMTSDQSSTGDFTGSHPQTSLKAYHCYVTMPLVIECEAETMGEAHTLGDILFSYIISERQIIREEFGFQVVTHPVLTDAIPTERSKEIWTISTHFAVTFDMRWGTTPHAPLMRDVRIALRGKGNVDEYLTTLAINNFDFNL